MSFWSFIFQADTLCASVSLFYSHIRTEQYVAGDWYASPCPKGWFDMLWHSFIFVLTFWFIMQKVSSRLLESADRKRKRERVASQGEWMLMCCHMRECWGALKLKSEARLSTQLDFKGAGSEWDTVESLQLSETGKKKSNPHSDVCWVKTAHETDLNTLTMIWNPFSY